MTKSIAKQISHDVEDIYDDLVRSLKKMSQHLPEGVGDTLSSSAVAVVHSAIDLAEQAKTQSRQWAQKAGEEVRSHPMTFAAIAAAAAAIVSFSLARRKARS